MVETARRLLVVSLIAIVYGGVSAGQSSGTGHLSLPDFTRGVDPQRAATRADAPSTDPAPQRDNRWLSNQGNSLQMPSTDPVRGANSGPRISSSAFGNPVATVAATQDPNSLEAQLENQTRNRTTNTTGIATSTNRQNLSSITSSSDAANSTNASGATGIPNSTASPSNSLGGLLGSMGAGRFSGAGSNTAGSTSPGSTSPGIAADSGSNRISPPLGINLPQRALQSTSTGLPTRSASDPISAPTLSNGLAGSTMSLPRGTTTGNATTATNSIPSTWTRTDIQTLAAMFNIGPSDLRLSNPEFVNGLYAQYVKHREQSQLAGHSNPIAANRSGSALDPRLPGRTQGTLSQGTLLPNSNSFNNSSSTDVLYDQYGRPVTIPATTIPATNATQRDTASSARVLAVERTLDRLLELQTRQQLAQTNPTSTANSSANDTLEEAKRQLIASGQFRPAGQTDAPTGPDANVGAMQQSPSDVSPDQASVFSANPVRNTNPWINIFLVCSLCFNVFLYICIHRMWYNYRDINVSNRLSQSGIGSSE